MIPNIQTGFSALTSVMLTSADCCCLLGTFSASGSESEYFSAVVVFVVVVVVVVDVVVVVVDDDASAEGCVSLNWISAMCRTKDMLIASDFSNYVS